ncbi:MAG TPA: response regulator transcription factor [Terriglobia bacterium]|nr:response regulator transcription factor [Terriglobia bacterium]
MREADAHRTQVLVAADSALARAGLEAVVREAGAILRLAGPAAVLSTVAREAAEREPGVVLLALDDDRQLSVISTLIGRDASAALGRSGEAASGAPAIVVLADDALAREAFDRGARSVLPRESAPEEIVAAVFAAAAGLVALRPETAELVIENGSQRPAFHAAHPGSADGFGDEALTPRELEVLNLVAEGAGNKEIAARLRISEHTVKFHVASILSKLGAASRTEAVALGVRRGLILL